MSNTCQVEIPMSFQVLYGGHGLHSRYASRDFVANRHQLCEEMTAMLTEMAEQMLSEQSMSQVAVLNSCRRSLYQRGSVFTANETVWIVCSLKERLEWQSSSVT